MYTSLSADQASELVGRSVYITSVALSVDYVFVNQYAFVTGIFEFEQGEFGIFVDVEIGDESYVNALVPANGDRFCEVVVSA